MKKIFYTIIAAAAILTGCNRELIVQEGTGSLSLDLDCKTDYTDVETKASKTDDEIINGLSIDIVRPYDNWKVNYTPFSDIRGKVIELGSGAYILTASSPEKKDAAFDQPIFEGKKNFDIKAGEVTTINVTCAISNAMVTIKLSENFVKELSDYTVTVSNGKGSLSWNKNAETDDFEPAADGDKTIYKAKKAGYFTLAPLTVTVDGHRVIDGTEAKTVYTIDQVNAADNHILNLDANVIGSLGGLTITVSQEVKPIDQSVVVPGFEEKPVPGDDPVDDGNDDTGDDNTGDDNTGGDNPGDDNTGTQEPAGIVLTWEDNPDFEPVYISADLDATLIINATAPINAFTVKAVSEVAGFNDAVKDMVCIEENKEPQIMDLINDTGMFEMLAIFGVDLPTGDEIAGKEEVTFSITQFLGLIDSMYYQAGAKHSFTLYVADENGEVLEKTLVFITK